MKNSEKAPVFKFFSIYFASVAALILAAGHFYYISQKTLLLQQEMFSMGQYARFLKRSDFNYEQKGYSYSFIDAKDPPYINLKTGENYFYKIFPQKRNKGYIEVKKNASEYKNKIFAIVRNTIIVQIALLLLFSSISYVLAVISLRPMKKTIRLLDIFIKDLIHDLNTPATSILINTKMLKKNAKEDQVKKIDRIEKSAKDISSLYENLNILLEEENMQIEQIDICSIVQENIENYKGLYPNLDIQNKCKDLNIKTNKKLFSRIVDNIISNACKYNKSGGYVMVGSWQNELFIEDSGRGISSPEKVYDRYYKESEGGHGLGMHIVYRLCISLNIKIKIESEKDKGTKITLSF